MPADREAAAAIQPGTGLYPGVAPIDAVGDGGFRFAGMSHRGGLLVLPTLMRAWAHTSMASLVIGDLADIITARPGFDFLLIGSGTEIEQPAAPIIDALAAADISFEVMSTRAACRTYNILLAESRSVAAVLLPVR